jgi:hypothetical protein
MTTKHKIKPKRGVRSCESAANERQRRSRSAAQPKVLMVAPLAGVATMVLKGIGIALTWRETQEDIPIAFQGLSSRLLCSCLTWSRGNLAEIWNRTAMGGYFRFSPLTRDGMKLLVSGDRIWQQQLYSKRRERPTQKDRLINLNTMSKPSWPVSSPPVSLQALSTCQ